MSILEQMTQTLLPLHLYALSPGSSVLAELSAYAQSLEKAAQRPPCPNAAPGFLPAFPSGPRASRGMRFVHFWKRSVLQALSKRMFQRIPSACCSQAMQAL